MTERYHVVCYRRVEDPGPPMHRAEAAQVRECLQRSHPKNLYVIEEVKG